MRFCDKDSRYRRRAGDSVEERAFRETLLVAFDMVTKEPYCESSWLRLKEIGREGPMKIFKERGEIRRVCTKELRYERD